MKPIATLALLSNPHNPLAEKLEQSFLQEGNALKEVRFVHLDWTALNPTMAQPPMVDGVEVDMVLVLGGDGTMIRACRLLGQSGVPLLGVNHGHLGFLTAIADHQIKSVLHELCLGQYHLEKRNLLSVTVEERNKQKDGDESPSQKESSQLFAVNDVYLNKMEMHSVLEVAISIDGVFVQTLRADGLILSTPTGSTAYALSAGGPIMHPQARGLVMLGVAPHSLTNRPIVLPETSQICLQLPQGMSGWLFADGHDRVLVDDQCKMKIERSEKTYTLAHPVGYNFYENLRDKLYWNEAPTANKTR